MSRRHNSRDTSTEPLAVDRATNTTRERVLACPEVVEYHREVREMGFKISLKGVQRFYTLYNETYAEQHPDNGGFLAYLMSYLDPTGEEAVHHVMSNSAA